MLRLSLGHLRPGGEPVELAGGLGPELIGLLDTAAVHRLVLCKALDVGFCGKLRRGRKHPVLPQSRIQIHIAFNCRHAQTSVNFCPSKTKVPYTIRSGNNADS